MKKHVPYRGAQFTKSRWSVDNGVVRHTARWQMYRAYLQMLRLLPDPHLWRVLAPAFRQRCAYRPPNSGILPMEPDNTGTIEEIEEAYRVWRVQVREHAEADIKREKHLIETRNYLNNLRAAVACHPHLLLKIIRQAYGQVGGVRGELLKSIASTSPPEEQPEETYELLGEDRVPIPAALQPVSSPRNIPEHRAHIREQEPYHEGKRQTLLAWQARWNTVTPPIYFPKGSGVSNGWEDKGIVDGLRAFAGVGNLLMHGRHYDVPQPRRLKQTADLPNAESRVILPGPEHLPTYHALSPVLRRIFPIKLKPTLREPPYPRPARHETKSEKLLWDHPVPLTKRVIRVAYECVWNRMEWVRPVSHDNLNDWVKCSFAEMKAWEAGQEIDTSTRSKKGASDTGPERPHKWGVPTRAEDKWVDAMENAERAALDEPGWLSDKRADFKDAHEEKLWTVQKSNMLRWIGKWEQTQVNGKVDRKYYIDFFSPTAAELQWMDAWEHKLFQEGSKFGMRGYNQAPALDPSEKVWIRRGNVILRDIGNGKFREEFRHVPGVSKIKRLDWAPKLGQKTMISNEKLYQQLGEETKPLSDERPAWG